MSLKSVRNSQNKRPPQRLPHIVKGDKCYTADDTLVFKLFVSGLATDVSDSEVESYFAQFGELQSVKTVSKGSKRRAFKIAFIEFKAAEAAAKCITANEHRINPESRQLKIRVADSWLQPSEAGKKEDSMRRKPHLRPEIPRLLSELNDDCLMHIFRHLTLKDKLSLSALGARLQHIFEVVFRLEHKAIDNSHIEMLNLDEWKIVLQNCGHHIESLQFNGSEVASEFDAKSFIELVPLFCTNLRRLELTDVVLTKVCKKKLGNLKKLSHLKLINVPMTDKIFLVLGQIPDLENLEVSGDDSLDLSGKNITKCKSLRHLTFDSLAPLYATELIKAVPLVSLSTNMCWNESSFQNFIPYAKELRSLTVRLAKVSVAMIRLQYIALLPKLEHLYIFSGTVRDDEFERLGTYKADQLITLEIYGQGYHLLTPSKKSTVCKLRKLQNLTWIRCKEMDNDFLEKLAKMPELRQLNIAGSLNFTSEGLTKLLACSEQIEKLNITRCPQLELDTVPVLIDAIRDRVTPLKDPLELTITSEQCEEWGTEDTKLLVAENSDVIRLRIDDSDEFDFYEEEQMDEMDMHGLRFFKNQYLNYLYFFGGRENIVQG